MTPLHELCVRTTLDPNDAYTIAKLLIDNGAKESLKVIDDEGYQPVHYAAAAGYEAVVRLFVENGDFNPHKLTFNRCGT
jgi:ankyrin repeat protein